VLVLPDFDRLKESGQHFHFGFSSFCAGYRVNGKRVKEVSVLKIQVYEEDSFARQSRIRDKG
jgi:hypothetical protein